MEKQNYIPLKGIKPLLWLIGFTAVLIIGIILIIIFQTLDTDKTGPEVITVSALEKIINVSELSTFTAVYNGVAEVMNEKKTTEIDYYVSYEARIDAGINFSDIVVTLDSRTQTIDIDVPEIHITETNVDIKSLDFIFYNDKANTSTVTQEAFKACEDDVKRESEQQTAIYDLAEQNAINILTALINPIIEQLDTKYTLNFK